MKCQVLRSPALTDTGCPAQVTFGISLPFGKLFQASRQITHVLRTLTRLQPTNIATHWLASHLHVLSTPPAFVLSQNQTLRLRCVWFKSILLWTLRNDLILSNEINRWIRGSHLSHNSIFKERWRIKRQNLMSRPHLGDKNQAPTYYQSISVWAVLVTPLLCFRDAGSQNLFLDFSHLVAAP